MTTPLARQIQADVACALAEDIAGGDLTANFIPAEAQMHAHVIARESAVICGESWFTASILALDPNARLRWLVPEGDQCVADQTIVTITGNARALLSAERTALNFLQLLSAVATKTAEFVKAVSGTSACIVDTRKTLPGLRVAQKYAVATGGGVNHRIGLFDAILIKENHIAAAGGVSAALSAALRQGQRASFIEIEVENLDQLEEALNAGATMVLLDNMNLATIRRAVALTAGRAILEVSGGVSLETVRALADTGVDRISIGSLTKDVKAIDFSMRFSTLGAAQ